MGPIEHMPRKDPVTGDDLYLTIDSRLQKVVHNTFPDTIKGAVVAINPQNGEVLVMYSSPAVDPNIFSLATSLRAKSWAMAALDTNQPLNNRATSGTYPPGSTFKLVSGLAGLDTKEVSSKGYMSRSCTGAYRIGSRLAHCWYLKGHGRLNVRDAVKVSCNVYFYQLGLRIDDKNINYYAEKLGLGHKTGIDLPHEKRGWLSGEKAYNKRFAKRKWKWTKGLVLDLAIGQAQTFTPIQLAMMVGGLGNKRAIYTPFLLKEVRSRNGEMISQAVPEIKYKLNFNDTAIEVINLAMEDVVIRAGGTGRRVRVDGVRVGGKSGSAENPHGEKTHGLFIACAPLDNPVIAVAAVLENAGHGGTVAAPVIGALLNYFFKETEEGKKLVIDEPQKKSKKKS
jgi:penicillin-binding protein 2